MRQLEIVKILLAMNGFHPLGEWFFRTHSRRAEI
jgi:hypothetical protein